MKKRVILILLALCLLLLIPGVTSANSPVPDPLRLKVQCRNTEIGTVILAMFAGDNGAFHPDTVYGARTVKEKNDSLYFYCEESDSQLYLEITKPDGTVLQSNTVSVVPYGSYRYDGKTNELKTGSGSSASSDFGGILLYMILLLVIITAAFGLTLLIEFLVGLCFRMKPFRYIVFANLITNILMNIILLFIIGAADGAWYWVALTVLELIVVLIEFLFYRNKYRNYKKQWVILLYTLAANAASLLAGVALLNLIF